MPFQPEDYIARLALGYAAVPIGVGRASSVDSGNQELHSAVSLRSRGSIAVAGLVESLGVLVCVLPERFVQATCVEQFQCLLQRLVIDRAASGAANWHCTLSSRVSLCTHPLRYCG